MLTGVEKPKDKQWSYIELLPLLWPAGDRREVGQGYQALLMPLKRMINMGRMTTQLSMKTNSVFGHPRTKMIDILQNGRDQ